LSSAVLDFDFDDVADRRYDEFRQRQLSAAEWPTRVLPAFQPLLARSRYKGAYGGRGGAKSHFFAEYLVRRCVEQPSLRVVCVREIQRSLEQSVKRLIEDKIVAMGYRGRFRTLNTSIQSSVNGSGGVIIFQGMQDHTADSLKSLEGYDVAWVEEAQSLSRRSLDLLRPTIRKEGSEIWASWNPIDPTDPIDEFFRGDVPPPSAISVRTSWRDNPYLPQEMKDEIAWDERRDPDKKAHVWEGEYRKISEARVFKNWRVEEFVSESKRFLYGSDWGFATDPTTMVRCFFKDSRTLCVDYERYRVGLDIENTPHFFDGLTCEGSCDVAPTHCRRPGHGVARGEVVTADSARPETISHLQRHGYRRMRPSIKGANSVEEGIAFLQSYDIIVHPRCKNLINELTYYSYKVDQLSGVVMPILVDESNHLIDALRYAIEETRRSRIVGGAL